MRRQPSLPLVGVCLFAACAGPVRAQQRGEGVVGYVLSVRGDWRIGANAEPAASGRPLTRGDSIRAGRQPWRNQEIVIVLRNGAALRYKCAETPAVKPTAEAWDCARPIDLPPPARGTLHARILDAVMNHFGEHASRPASLVSRGILDPDLREAVAELQDGAVNLSDALSALPAGDYGFTLTPIQVDGAVVRRTGNPATARLSWDPRSPQALAASGVEPGLHELGIVGGSDVAWILICTGASCDAMRAQFQEVRDLSSQWVGQVSAADARAFARAALDLIARQGAGS